MPRPEKVQAVAEGRCRHRAGPALAKVADERVQGVQLVGQRPRQHRDGRRVPGLEERVRLRAEAVHCFGEGRGGRVAAAGFLGERGLQHGPELAADRAVAGEEAAFQAHAATHEERAPHAGSPTATCAAEVAEPALSAGERYDAWRSLRAGERQGARAPRRRAAGALRTLNAIVEARLKEITKIGRASCRERV